MNSKPIFLSDYIEMVKMAQNENEVFCIVGTAKRKLSNIDDKPLINAAMNRLLEIGAMTASDKDIENWKKSEIKT